VGEAGGGRVDEAGGGAVQREEEEADGVVRLPYR
jgi:hypothetical protein